MGASASIQHSSEAAGAPPRKIAVLHLIYSPCYGGIESVMLNWVKNFDLDRFEIHVAYFAGDRNREEPFLKAARAAGLNPIPVPWTKFKPFLRCAREVARIVREHDIQIIHTHAYYGDAVGALAGYLCKAKTVATIYVWGKYELHRQLMQFIDWLSMQFLDKVTAHCMDTARKTFVIGTPRSRIPVLLPGYPPQADLPSPEQKQAWRRAAGLHDDEVLLLNAARLAPEKAQDQLLRSFQRLLDRHDNVRLWISGVGLETVEQELRRLIDELKLQGRAELIGFRQNYRELLNMADVMVHPSHVEGIPLSLLGAMEAGLPIVASAVGGVPEIVDHGKTGLLVKENDWEDFAEATSSLVLDAERRKSMGVLAAERVRTVWSIREATRRVEDVYLEMLDLPVQVREGNR